MQWCYCLRSEVALLKVSVNDQAFLSKNRVVPIFRTPIRKSWSAAVNCSVSAVSLNKYTRVFFWNMAYARFTREYKHLWSVSFSQYGHGLSRQGDTVRIILAFFSSLWRYYPNFRPKINFIPCHFSKFIDASRSQCAEKNCLSWNAWNKGVVSLFK